MSLRPLLPRGSSFNGRYVLSTRIAFYGLRKVIRQSYGRSLHELSVSPVGEVGELANKKRIKSAYCCMSLPGSGLCYLTNFPQEPDETSLSSHSVLRPLCFWIISNRGRQRVREHTPVHLRFSRRCR